MIPSHVGLFLFCGAAVTMAESRQDPALWEVTDSGTGALVSKGSTLKFTSPGQACPPDPGDQEAA